MDQGADSGEIVSQEIVSINESDDAEMLYNKLIETAQCQVRNWLPLMASNEIELIPQDHSQANYWRKRGRRDGAIDFRMNSQTIYNFGSGFNQAICRCPCNLTF